MSDTRNIVVRWPTDPIQTVSNGSFVAYGDYLTLERENAALQAELAESARLHAMGSEREARLMARVAELERDAGRYRWLRDQNWTQRGLFVVSANNQDVVRLGTNCPSNELLDAAIDAAMRGTE